MSRPAANLGGRKKGSVYLFIQELIQEGEYAWFVNDKGRFLLKWDKAVELYIEYRAAKNPKFKKNTNRRRASNALRAALLHHYEKDGAKEFAESRKLGGKAKVIERQFQMPSSVFQSLFGSSVQLPDNHQHASGDQSDTSGVSGCDHELMQGNQSLLQGLHENLKYDADMTPKQSRMQPETSGISVSDPELTQEDNSLQLLADPDKYVVDMEPKESRLKGGGPFWVSFHPCLDTNVTSVHAVFVKAEVIFGNVKLAITPEGTFGRPIPGAPSSGWAKVILEDQNDTRLGSTEIFYFPDEVEAVVMVQNPNQFKNFSEEVGYHTASSFDSSDGDPQRNGAFGNSQQVQFLCLLIHTAAREGAQQFIEMIFSTSAGRLVFDAYKDSQPLPEVVARDHGHNKTACYLEGVTKRFSVRTSASKEYLKKINWSELVQAAEEAKKCNAENESCYLISDLSKDAGYLGDLETSSCEPHSSGSEDDISILSKKGRFTKHIKPTEKELPSLNPPVEPSSDETGQFDQADDEEMWRLLYILLNGSEEFRKLKEEFWKRKVPLEIYARGPEAVKAYGKALTKGKACHKRISLMLIGQDQAGKTSLKKLLNGENFNEKEESTVGIETDPLYLKASREIWKSGKVKEEVQFDPEDQFGHLELELLRKISREDMENLTWLSPELDSVSDTKSESVLVPPGKSSAKSSRHGSTKPLRNTESLQGRFLEEVARLVEKMRQEEENANHEDNIYSVLWDFCGQSVYYETYPIFLKEKAIYILLSDLSRDPEERAILPVKTGLFESKVDIDCNKTNLDYLDFWMSSIYSLVSPDVLSSQETTPNASLRLPQVFLVCTHADTPSGGSNARDLALEMYGTLLCKRYREHLYKDVFVVDNTKSGGEEECVEGRRLREEVLAVAKELQLTKEEIPLKWLRYENELRKKRDKWITLEEAKWVAFQDCEIQEDDEFSTLLNFLHDQRIVIHFSGSPELEKIVILDPQWLVDVLKNVITARRFKHTEHPVKDLWIQFEETGILDEKVIDHAWRDLLDNQESHKSLIAIMERLSLISPWPSSKDSKQYLVPSMLMLPPTDDVVQLLDSVHVPPLFVTFASGRVPPGLFSRLILHFLSWCGGEWKSKVSPQLFHNFAMFHILPDQGISLIFCCHSIAIEVAVYSGDNDEKRTDIFRAVHWQLRFSLECMRKEFHWLNNMKYDMCVCCPVCSRPGSGKCRDHDVRGCECLHFLSESDLRQRQHCNRLGRSPLGDRRIWVKQFECWFLIGEGEEGAGMSTNQPLQAIHTTSHGGSLGAKGIFSIEGKKRKDLALPKNIKTSILSIPLNSESDVKDIVIQFQEALKLEPASLTSPEPETKSMIRYLALIAKSEKRDDLVRHLREITPAGTTGPLLNEDMSVDCMPHKQFKDLTFSLSGGDEWKLLAERLCFSPMEIRFLDNRVVNPSEVVLSAVAKHRHLSVGEIYDTLVDCELPAIADLM